MSVVKWTYNLDKVEWREGDIFSAFFCIFSHPDSWCSWLYQVTCRVHSADWSVDTIYVSKILLLSICIRPALVWWQQVVLESCIALVGYDRRSRSIIWTCFHAFVRDKCFNLELLKWSILDCGFCWPQRACFKNEWNDCHPCHHNFLLFRLLF